MNALRLPFFLLAILPTLLVSNVGAYPSGAPICKITPTTQSFLLTAANEAMGVYNDNLTLTMQAPKDYTLGSGPVSVNITGDWAGILLFAEGADGYHVGEFATPNFYKYVVGTAPDCLNRNEKATLTHTAATKKTGVTTFMWTPPTVYEGPLIFKSLIVAGDKKGFIALNSTQVNVADKGSSSGIETSSGPTFWEFVTVGMAFVSSICGLGI